MSNLDKPKNNGETKVVRNEKGQIMPGSVLNPNGNPGAGYKQKWDKMIGKVAEDKGITKEQAELDLFSVAYDQALKGNFQFFKDAMDRVYGPVKQSDTNIQVNNVIPLLGGDSVQTHDGNREVIEAQQED